MGIFPGKMFLLVRIQQPPALIPARLFGLVLANLNLTTMTKRPNYDHLVLGSPGGGGFLIPMILWGYNEDTDLKRLYTLLG